MCLEEALLGFGKVGFVHEMEVRISRNNLNAIPVHPYPYDCHLVAGTGLWKYRQKSNSHEPCNSAAISLQTWCPTTIMYWCNANPHLIESKGSGNKHPVQPAQKGLHHEFQSLVDNVPVEPPHASDPCFYYALVRHATACHGGLNARGQTWRATSRTSMRRRNHLSLHVVTSRNPHVQHHSSENDRSNS